MRRWAIGIAVALLALGVASQLLVPGIASDRVEDRLTDRGGEADVSVSAFPALRLLFDDGSRFEAQASGLDLELSQQTEALDRLDGFDDVNVWIDDFDAGPFRVSSFALVRDGDGPYHLVSRSRASPADMVDFGVSELGLPGSGLLGGIAEQALGDRPLPIDLDMELTSNDGEIAVVSGGGTVAGLPTGVLGELITEAIVSQL